MKGGFLKKPRPDPEAAKYDADGKRLWEEKMVDTTVKVFNEILGERDNLGWNDLERRLRTGTGAREYSDMTSLHGHGHNHGAYGMTPVEDDVAARLIKQFSTPLAFQEMIVPVMEQSAGIFHRVLERGKADRVALDSEQKLEIQRNIIKEALVRHMLKVINAANSGTHASGSVDAGLLATPQGYNIGDLNSLEGDTIAGLMQRGYGVQDEFMGGTIVDDCFNELELLEFDGKFVEVQQQKLVGIRTDKICWFTPDDLDREKHPGLSALFKKMISLPFELNKKCNLCLQGSCSFQLACYSKKGYYKQHVDGGYGDLNNGRKITCVYYANPSWTQSSGGELRVFKRQPNPYEIEKCKKEGLPVPEANDKEVLQEISPIGDRLVLFRSRDMPHEVMQCGRKRFAVSMWVHGPPGPGDQPDGYYTPT